MNKPLPGPPTVCLVPSGRTRISPPAGSLRRPLAAISKASSEPPLASAMSMMLVKPVEPVRRQPGRPRPPQPRLVEGGDRRMWSTFVMVRESGGWRIAAIRNMLPAPPVAPAK